jgi:co-chaperonin GroES (HSP10)
MKPTTNRLLVKVIEEKKPKKGEEQKVANSLMHAEVVKKGPEVKNTWLKDIIVFAPYGIDEVVIGKEKYLIVSEELVLAVHEQ